MRPGAKKLHEDLLSETGNRTRIQFSVVGYMAETQIKLARLHQCTPGEAARNLTIKVANQAFELVQVRGFRHARP